MHPITCARRLRLWGGLLLVAGLAGTATYAKQPVQPPDKDPMIGDVRVDAKTGALIVPVGGLVRFDPRLPDAPSDILISREDVVHVRLDPNNPRALLLTGRTPGLSRVSIVLKDRPRIDYDVIVQPDYELLRNLIRRTVPTANVEVTPGVGNVIILSGYATSPQDADIILRLTQSQIGGSANNVINAVQVGGVQQVQIDVVIASVDRDKTRSRGFDFFLNGRSFQFNSIVSGLIGPQPLGGGFPTVITPSPAANLQFGIVPTQFFGALQALKTEGLAKYLAEPRVVTQTGRPAFFLAGGRQAVLGPASGINGPGVQFEQVGTQLEVLPIVYGNNQIWLEINPQVRTVNQSLGIATTFGTTPGFSEQQVRCAVMLESGQTFVIGGLIQNTVAASSARVPVLGELPFVGTAFSRVTYDERETELVIMVTPRLVGPLDCNQVPKRLPSRETRSPDDYELFLEGILEAPRGQRKVWNGRCYNAAYKCDPTIGAYPCVGPLCTGPGGVAGPGGNCGPQGCAAPVGGRVIVNPVIVPAVPAGPAVLTPLPPTTSTLPVLEPATPPSGGSGGAPAPLPTTLPAVPGAPVTPGSDAGPVGLPASPPPPVVIPPVEVPEAPRN
ncbi:MAG: pulD 2 [Gemmataceae bacterium]|nr:pulD 2 [Gemmataceae bacterium]